MRQVKLFLLAITIALCILSCDDNGQLVSFENDISGTWKIELKNIGDSGFNLPWTQGVGNSPGDDCCADGSATINLDGASLFYSTENSVSASGKYESILFSELDDTGIVEGNLNADGTASGTYTINWTNKYNGESKTLEGVWEGVKR